MENKTSYTPEQIADKLQLLGMLPVPQKPFVTFLTGNAGLVTSLGDLIDKIDNGTATRNDYIDVVKDLGAVGTGVAGLFALATGGTVPIIIVGIGVGLAVLDYIDSRNYDPDEMMKDITSIKDSISDWMTESELFGSNKDYDELENLLDSMENSHSNTNPYDFNLTSSYFRRDPLALDTNKDGFIATTSVTESETYFDLTGDGIKERTGWIKGEDALLVYDANEDGQIGGISEVFGNATTEGFDELRDTIDSNYDNKIDRKDILFNRLQLWHDYDQDGSVDEGELKSLKEEGITSIDLNSVQTSINTNGNVITEASHYTTSTGEKELVADLELIYMPKVDPTIDAGDAGSIDVDTIFLPQLRGYGYVGNSLLAYNADDISLVANHFDEFVAKTIFTCKTFSITKA